MPLATVFKKRGLDYNSQFLENATELKELFYLLTRLFLKIQQNGLCLLIQVYFACLI